MLRVSAVRLAITRLLVGALCVAILPGIAWAQARAYGELAGDTPDLTAAVDDPSFGPLLVIEDIEIVGNQSTASRVILGLLPIVKGDTMRAGDPRFQRARFKLLATGYFREVTLEPRRGSQRGHVILVVRVKERGTVVLNSLYFGTSSSTPWWAGLDITERNFMGTGLGVGIGGVYADEGDIAGSEDQWALTMRLIDSAILGSRYGAHGTFLYTQASEPYRVRGDPSDAVVTNFSSFSYSRLGGKAGMSIDLSPLSRLAVDARIERVSAGPPLAATRELPDGNTIPVDPGLLSGNSRVITLAAAYDRDTRTDPVLPWNGNRLLVFGEIGTSWLGSSYDYAVALARYEHWWPVHGNTHVLSIHLTGGLVLGDAPLFDQLHVSDFNRLLTPRAFGLVLSTESSPDIFEVGADDVTYGDAGGSAVVEYSYQLFRERFHVYGGDLFIGAGLWSLARADDARDEDRALHRAFLVDVIIDAGLRIDTEIGIFELTFANALGRVPL